MSARIPKPTFLGPRRSSRAAQAARLAVGVALGLGALLSAVLLGGVVRPLALICVFAVLISALLAGPIAGWVSLAITSLGLWFLAPRGQAGFSSSQPLVLWCAYTALAIVVVEVIRRMQLERRRLIEHDQRLRLARRAARIWFWEWDLQHNLVRWSREGDSEHSDDEYLEIPLEVYINRRVHREDRDKVLTALFEAAAGHQRFQLEYRVVGEDGSLHWLSAKGKIFQDDGTTLMLGMASEITTQKLADELRSHYRAVLGSLTEGVCYIDNSGAVQYMNTAAERMLGYGSEEMRGKYFHELLHSGCGKDPKQCCLVQAIEARQTCSAQQNTFTTKSGDKLIAEYTAAPVTSDGATLGAVITFRDISERKRAEEALQASEKMAATGRIAATISHELRNPLDSVTQLLYLVKQSPNLGEAERQQLNLIDQELSRMAEVAQQTLAMHRQARAMVPVNLGKLLDGVLLLYGKKIRSQKIQIDKRYEWQGEVYGYPAELRQVFTNLIVNAVDAMPGGGKLCLHVRRYHEANSRGRSGVLVALADSGTGIPKDARRHLFEPFFSTKGEKGSGVGLWVSSGIIQRHRGSIRVHSSDRPGRSYTCFEVFLPENTPQPHPQEPAMEKQKGAASRFEHEGRAA